LLEGELIEALRNKGRMRPVVERIPVDVVMRRDVSLLGAWARAVVIYNRQHAH
jgi:glucokinase